MVQIVTLVSAATLLAGVHAACPPNAQLCGSEILNVYKCDTAAHLQSITPHNSPAENIRTDIYSTNAAGIPQIPFADCSLHGCSNSNLGATPPRQASCYTGN